LCEKQYICAESQLDDSYVPMQNGWIGVFLQIK